MVIIKISFMLVHVFEFRENDILIIDCGVRSSSVLIKTCILKNKWSSLLRYLPFECLIRVQERMILQHSLIIVIL